MRLDGGPEPSFTPLRKTPIREILCDHPERQAAKLSLLWALEKINKKPALDFFRKNNPAHAALLQWIEDTSHLAARDAQFAAVKAKLKEPTRVSTSTVKGQIEGGQGLLSLPAAEVTTGRPAVSRRLGASSRCPGPARPAERPDHPGRSKRLEQAVRLAHVRDGPVRRWAAWGCDSCIATGRASKNPLGIAQGVETGGS